MKRCVIVGAGEIYSEIDVREGDVVIAADGGYKYLCDADLKPDVLIGDFDSLGELPSLENVKIVKHPIEKDETDMYLAYKLGVELGCDEFYLYGGVGGREDHTFANYCLLLNAKNENKQVFLVGNKSVTYVIKNEKINVRSEKTSGISVFAFGGEASGVNIKGLKYEADDITLKCDYPIGVSNSFAEKGEGEISVASGALLIIQEV